MSCEFSFYFSLSNSYSNRQLQVSSNNFFKINFAFLAKRILIICAGLIIPFVTEPWAQMDTVFSAATITRFTRVPVIKGHSRSAAMVTYPFPHPFYQFIGKANPIVVVFQLGYMIFQKLIFISRLYGNQMTPVLLTIVLGLGEMDWWSVTE